MAKKKRKGSDKKQKGSCRDVSPSRDVSPRRELRAVIKVPEGAVLRGCKKTRRKLREHLRLRAEIHSQLRFIASLFVLRIFLTCLVGYPTPGSPSAPPPPAVQPPQPPDAPPLPPLPSRAPAQPAPAQPASMECDTDSDCESDCDSDPEPQSDSESESESEPEPVAQPPQRRCSARLAAMAPAAPTGPPLPLDCEDPLMLRQLKDFCKFFANPNFKTCYNQLQRRLVRNRHPMLMPAFENPSNQALVAKLQELGSINFKERIVKLYAKAARAKLGWSGEEAQLFIRMACGYGINAHSSELKAATLDKGHVADLIKEANKHRRLLGMKKEGSLQDTLPLPCRMRHAVHVCRLLERWQQPHPPPVPGQPKRGKRRGVGPRTLTCPPPFTLTPMARVGVHFIKVDSRVLHGVCKQLGLTKEPRAAFTSEPALKHHWARWFNTNKLGNQGFAFERLVDTDGVSVCVHYTRPLPPPPAPPPDASSSSSTSSRPSAAAAAAHAVGIPHIGRGIAEMREFVFDTDTQIGVGIDPGVTQAVSAASGVWDPATGQLMADQLRRWKLTKGQVKHGSGLNNARRNTERWLAPIKPHLQHLAAASSAGTSLEANLKHITVTLATWDAVWEVYLDLKWARQRLRLYGAQDRALEQFFNKLEREMAQLSMNRHGRAKQLVVFFGAATIGTAGGWGADAVLRACRKVVCRPRGTDQLRGRVVLVDEHRTSRVSSAVNGQQPCEVELDKLSATRPAGWKPPAGQVDPRLVRPAWSQERGQPVRGMMWCPVVAPRKPPQAPRSSQAATQPAASEPGPSTPPPAKRSKPAAEPTKGKGKGKASKAKPAPQPGRWVDRDCNAALNMQRIGESRWRPLELCYWPDQGALPAKGKEYPGLGYKRVRDKPPKAQEQQQQPAMVIKVPEGAVLRGCKKTRRKLREHLRLRAEIHSQLRFIASLFVLRIFLTCLVGYPTPGSPSAPQPPAVQPPQPPDAPPLPPLPSRAPAQPAPAQPASMECDTDSDSTLEAEAPRQLRQGVARLEGWAKAAASLPSCRGSGPVAASSPGCWARGVAVEVEVVVVMVAAIAYTGPTTMASSCSPDRDTNSCLNFQRIGESMQHPLELCQWKDLESLAPSGQEYQQSYKLVNDGLPKGRESYGLLVLVTLVLVALVVLVVLVVLVLVLVLVMMMANGLAWPGPGLLRGVKVPSWRSLDCTVAGLKLDVPSLYTKLVKRGRGGYCFEVNTAFSSLLAGMGYTVRQGAARVVMDGMEVDPQLSSDHLYLMTPHSHSVLFVSGGMLPLGKQYLCDAGLGGNTLTRPVEIPPQEVMVNTPTSPTHGAWHDLYFFTLAAFGPMDFVAANYFTSTFPQSLFLKGPFCSRPDEKGGRYILMGGQLKYRDALGVSQTQPISSSADMIMVLRSHFGIDIPPNETVSL
ncbi:hypothetical protein QJQ45_007024 [Haematococcus lacustris]|nr:hypothetical protein QJQ45_007024 [Haematococcus lacustris]